MICKHRRKFCVQYLSPVNNGIFLPYQLVQDFFHQQNFSYLAPKAESAHIVGSFFKVSRAESEIFNPPAAAFLTTDWRQPTPNVWTGPKRKKNHIGVSKNSGTPKSSILIGFSIINHPFWGTPIFGNIHMHHSTFRWLKITSWSYFFQQFAGKNWMLGRKSTQIASL